MRKAGALRYWRRQGWSLTLLVINVELAGRQVVVVGMERSGVAAVKLLLEKGAVVRAVDEKPHDAVLGVSVEPQAEPAFHRADLVVISPGVPADLELLEQVRRRGVPVIGELELA